MKNARLGFFGLFGLWMACSSSEVPATELLVAVRADAVMAQKLSRVRVRVYPIGASANATPSADQPFDLAPSDQSDAAEGEERLPLSFAIRQGRADGLLLVVEGFVINQHDAVVEQKVTASFAPRHSRVLSVLLSSACYQRTCTPFDQTCDAVGGGNCADVPVAQLSELTDRDGGELSTPDVLEPCVTDTRDCGGENGAPRVCVASQWTSAAACGAGEKCQAGECVAPLPHDAGTLTDCDAADACVAEHNDCPSDACSNGQCLDGDGTYSCACDSAAGYTAAVGGQSCVDVHECDHPEATVCQGMAGPASMPFSYSYACTEASPFYRCVGQLAEYPWQEIDGGFRFTQRTYAAGKLVDYSAASADNVVYDHVTNLEWEQTLSVDGDVSWEVAKAHCATVTTAGGGFRTPSYVELLGLVDDTRSARSLPGPNQENVAFDETLFPGPHDAWYWTSSSRGTNADSAYVVLQINGVGGLYGDKRQYVPAPHTSVRCVRDALSR